MERFFGRAAKLKGKRVLVVEDEALVSMLVEDEVCDTGAEVVGPAPTVVNAPRLAEASMADGGLSAAVVDINLEGEAAGPVPDKLAALGVTSVFATDCGEHHGIDGHPAAPTLAEPINVTALVAAVQALAPARA